MVNRKFAAMFLVILFFAVMILFVGTNPPVDALEFNVKGYVERTECVKMYNLINQARLLNELQPLVYDLYYQDYAKKNNVTWGTAYRWFRDGKIPNARYTPGGSIVVDEEEPSIIGKTIVYARVSNSSRR